MLRSVHSTRHMMPPGPCFAQACACGGAHEDALQVFHLMRASKVLLVPLTLLANYTSLSENPICGHGSRS